MGGHLKNVYNDYVYFWRWALWKVFEQSQGPGIVSFISASSYLRGPGFVGMRQHMRKVFDELWILDLEGGSLGARKTENVFAITTPVAIATGTRRNKPNDATPAKVHYCRIEGTQEKKLAQLAAVTGLKSLEWQDCFDGWMEPFLPRHNGNYYSWPLLTNILPFQKSGVKAGRTWPIETDKSTLLRRWERLALADSNDRVLLFKNSPTGKKTHQSAPHLIRPDKRDPSIAAMPSDSPCPSIIQFSFRSFDRQLLIADNRLLDRSSPELWACDCPKQIYLTSLLTEVLGPGPAATVCASLPDLHHFRGSYGGKDVVPLWRDKAASKANLVNGLLDLIGQSFGKEPTPEEFLAYVYAILANPGYVEHFCEELTYPGPRIPITKDFRLFQRGAKIGSELIYLHTYGERMSEDRDLSIPKGKAFPSKAIPQTPDKYPEKFRYDEATKELHVGEGTIANVDPAVFHFSVSGLKVVWSWLSYRMKDGAGKKSSSLDDIRPERWTKDFTKELLELLWVLEHTIALYPKMDSFLEEVLASTLFVADELPKPSDDERKPPEKDKHDESDQTMLPFEE